VPQQFIVDSRSAPMPTECSPDFFGFEPVEGPARLRKRGDRSPDGRVAGGAGFDGNIFGFFLPKFVVLQ
jgi:hypothetical protein